jgi:four helix bundle protein
MNNIQDFEDMKVWQDAQDLAVAAYQDFASIKDFTFTDQIKRAAVSVSNNIAEGSERGTNNDFARFLDISKGSTGEVRSMYRLANRLGWIEESIVDLRCGSCKSISRQLAGFAKYLRNNKS